MSTASGFSVERFLRDVDAWRERQELTLSQVAYRADVHPFTMKSLLTGHRRTSLSLGVAARLAECADLSLDAYIEWKDPEVAYRNNIVAGVPTAPGVEHTDAVSGGET